MTDHIAHSALKSKQQIQYNNLAASEKYKTNNNGLTLLLWVGNRVQISTLMIVSGFNELVLYNLTTTYLPFWYKSTFSCYKV